MKELTFVFSARNDNYMGNFIYRLTSAINFLARNLELAHRLEQAEILLADWNSDVPLRETLRLSPAAASVTRFVRIPPAVAAAALNPDQVFHAACSFNAVIRRAEGRFIMMLDSDALVPRHSVRALFDLLEGNSGMPLKLSATYFVAERRHVPWEVVQSEPSLEGWNDYLATHGGDLPTDIGLPGLGICQCGWLAHRNIWHDCRGYDERLGYWGWIDAELMLRISQEYPWAQLAGIGVQIFHMEHWPRNRRSAPAKTNPQVVSRFFAANDANWGLGDKLLENLAAEPALALTAPQPDPVTETGDGKSSAWPPPRLDGFAQAPRDSAIREPVSAVMEEYHGLEMELKAFELLAACAAAHCPGVHVEFGASVGRCSSSIVVRLSPGVDLYAIDDWERRKEPSDGPAGYSTALQKAEFRGCLRFVPGDLRSALTRLRKSLNAPLAVDLAIFRERLFADGAVEALEELLSCLAPLGAVVCVSENPEFWRRAQQMVQLGQAQLEMAKVDAVTALIVSRSANVSI